MSVIDPETIEWIWPGRRSTVVHAYVRGAGTGDGSLCGVPLTEGQHEAKYFRPPWCKRCLAKIGDCIWCVKARGYGEERCLKHAHPVPVVPDPVLPTTVCSVVWSDGHPWVLDGEPGVPTPRMWVGIGRDGMACKRPHSTMKAAGFSVIYMSRETM